MPKLETEQALGEIKDVESEGILVEKICKNVEVVEFDGVRKYRVVWKAGINGKTPAVCSFETGEQVIHQHERVLEGYLGAEIPFNAERILKIPGETQKMNKLSAELFSLAGQFIIPLTPEDTKNLKERTVELRKELLGARNAYKVEAEKKLEKAFLSEEKEAQIRAVLDANLAVLKRTEECLGIVGGTTTRLRIVTRKLNEWEETISKTFLELAQILKDLENGIYADGPRKREQLARHISGESEFTIMGKLNQIAGPEYWQRIQSREVQRLAWVGDFLRREDDERVKKILTAAIIKLKRVPWEREELKLKDRRL